MIEIIVMYYCNIFSASWITIVREFWLAVDRTSVNRPAGNDGELNRSLPQASAKIFRQHLFLNQYRSGRTYEVRGNISEITRRNSSSARPWRPLHYLTIHDEQCPSTQYMMWLYGWIHLIFGHSRTTGRPITCAMTFCDINKIASEKALTLLADRHG
jgi:hypothetical protein